MSKLATTDTKSTAIAEEYFSKGNNERCQTAGKGVDKFVRKLARKNSKMMNVITKHIGINVSQTPSQWVVVWGLGIAGANSKQFIQSYFNPHPLEVRLIPEKTYCFLRFFTLKDAIVIKQHFDGNNFNDRQTIYVGFLDADPPNEDLESIECFKSSWPEGLTLVPDFLTPDEEKIIIENLGPQERISEIGTRLRHRYVRHFGYEFRYGTNDIDFNSPLSEGIPPYLMPFIFKLKINKVMCETPEQLTVNQYLPGQGIPPHVDTHSCFEGPIVSLSLGSDTVMNFRCKSQIVSILVPARCLLVMDKAARYGWTHCIPSRKFDIIPDKENGGLTVLNRGIRTSLTFRRLRRGRVCSCSYPEMCDSQDGKITNDNAADLEEKLVHDVYEEIAPHFDETRHKPWPKVEEFIQNIETGETLLDLGCGNGKYFNLNERIVQLGSDMSTGLLEICRDKNGEVLRANALRIPFKDESFKAVICIAVLHHISTKERRLAALQEMIRVMRIGGQALIYVWAKNQRYKEQESNWASKQGMKDLVQNKFVANCVQPLKDYSFLPIHDHEIDFPRNDMLVPWVNTKDRKKSVHHRYYHVFDKGELEELVNELDQSPTILNSYYDQGNWVVKIQKNPSTYYD